MNQTQPAAHAPAWVMFTYVSFAGSLAMLMFGIVMLPIDLWMRAFLFMGMLMLVQSCITMTKTQRDNHESSRMVNRIEDARTEKLLMEVGRQAYHYSCNFILCFRCERCALAWCALRQADHAMTSAR